jgi:transmembrane sensor
MGRSNPGDDVLLQEALDILIRLQNDPQNEISQGLALEWQARSSIHAAAWREATGLHSLAGNAILTARSSQPSHCRQLSRRRLMVGGGAALAASATGLVFLPSIMARADADFDTTTAELKRVDLPDGTTVTLGPLTALNIEHVAEQRRVEFMQGMAFFDVPKDLSRPLRVSYTGIDTVTHGAAFDMSEDAGILSVTVELGLVDVRMPVVGSSPVRLGQGDWVRFDLSSQRAEQGKSDSPIGSWRQNMIIAEEETLGAVVARIGRWQQGKIVFADQSLRKRRISGLFDVSRPLAALEAVVDPYGAKVRQLSPWLTVISPV